MKKQKKGPPPLKKPHPIREGSLLYQLLELVAESIVRDRDVKTAGKS